MTGYQHVPDQTTARTEIPEPWKRLHNYIISICYSYVQLFGPDLFKLYYHCIRLHPRYLEADRTFVVMELLVSYSQKASGAGRDVVAVNWRQFDSIWCMNLTAPWRFCYGWVLFSFLVLDVQVVDRKSWIGTTNLEDFFPSFSIYPGALLSLRVLVTWMSWNLLKRGDNLFPARFHTLVLQLEVWRKHPEETGDWILFLLDIR